MIRINQIKRPYDAKDSELFSYILKKYKINIDEISNFSIIKKSFDLRKKDQKMSVYSVEFHLKNEYKFLKRYKEASNVTTNKWKSPIHGAEKLKHNIVIAGAGPAGLFCALTLAREGYAPILFERGSDVETRTEIVKAFWNGEHLNTSTNVQFGEGGAGTFSDGKLNTLVKDPSGRHKKVLETFIEFGADPEILYIQKPHVGTDVLSSIVKKIREEIISFGGEIYFNSLVTDLMTENDHITGVCINHKKWIPCDAFIPAIGHSARDTFSMLKENGLKMSRKAFAIGIRIEHPQTMINLSQYGAEWDPVLGSASYKLTAKTSNGRSVYSFCMCPGGHVVNAASEEGHIAVNGMSYAKRNAANANSALIVTVTPDDFASDDVLSGVDFQRRWEKAAFEAGNGHVPVQLFDDFKKGTVSTNFGEVKPVHKGETVFADLNTCLPQYVCDSLKEGIDNFGKKIKGYDRPDAILSGVETRTSSPVRIERDETFQSNIKNIYPCGEGAGYAGGITSAAMDGIKIAEALIRRYQDKRL